MTSITFKKDSKFYRFKNVMGKVLVYLGLCLYGLWILLPFIIVLITSVTPDYNIQSEFKFWTGSWTLDGYKNALIDNM